MKVRQVQPDDAAQWLALRCALWPEQSADLPRDAEDCSTDRIAFLEGWYVAPAARRRGVGRALVAAAEEWGRAQGCTEFSPTRTARTR